MVCHSVPLVWGLNPKIRFDCDVASNVMSIPYLNHIRRSPCFDDNITSGNPVVWNRIIFPIQRSSIEWMGYLSRVSPIVVCQPQHYHVVCLHRTTSHNVSR